MTEPAVDPAIPPRNISPTTRICSPCTHAPKSAVANPVVVMTETDVKVAALTASAIPEPPRFSVRPVSTSPIRISPTARVVRAAYRRNSPERR